MIVFRTLATVVSNGVGFTPASFTILLLVDIVNTCNFCSNFGPQCIREKSIGRGPEGKNVFSVISEKRDKRT